MGLFLLVPGLILWLVNATWFSGQHTVGIILTAVGGALLVLQLLWFAFVASKVNQGFRGL